MDRGLTFWINEKAVQNGPAAHELQREADSTLSDTDPSLHAATHTAQRGSGHGQEI
jgi:hypothetical protein